MLFFLVGVLLLLLQTTFLHLLPIGPIVPDLVLVLCVYFGLHHPTVGAALGSFLLGYSIDVVSSRMLGLNAFAMSLVFLAVYFSSRVHLAASSGGEFPRRFARRLGQGRGLGAVVWVIFLSVEGFWMGAASLYNNRSFSGGGARAVGILFVTAR